MNKAYTLTEVLVVIVILAVLASVLFPVGSRAKTRAQQVGCISNLHQLYVATELYINDYGDLQPIGDDTLLTRTYLGGTRLRCPVQKNPIVSSDYRQTQIPEPDTVPPGIGELEIKEWWACREKRGSEFPFVVDPNHASTLAGYDSGGDSFYLVARESGQAQRVPGVVWHDYFIDLAKPPCTLDVGTLNL